MKYESVSEEFIHPNIQKNKYIYELRNKIDESGFPSPVEVLKYPVIYENKDYVYFKTPGNSALKQVQQRQVYSEVSQVLTKFATSGFFVDYIRHDYCWEDPGSTKKAREDLQNIILAKKSVLQKLEKARKEADSIQLELDNIRAKREEAMKQVFKLEKELNEIDALEAEANK